MIRRFGLRDIKLVSQLQTRGVAFDLKQLLMSPGTPLAAALVGLLSHEQLGTLTSIFDETCNHTRKRGFVSVSPRRHLPYWDLAFLAPALDAAPHATYIWARLLSYLAILGANSGITRIYAQAAEDPEVEEVLHQAGYSVISRAEAFVLVGRPSPVMAPRGLHRVEPQDEPALLRLYHEVVPPLVQQAEGMRLPWSASLRAFGFLASNRAYVWADKDRANAFIGMRETARANWLEVIVRPEYRAEILPVIKHVLANSGNLTGVPLYCLVSDYNIGLSWVLRALGFESYSRQVMFVQHTMVKVPTKQRVLVASLEGGMDISAPAGTVLRLQRPIAPTEQSRN